MLQWGGRQAGRIPFPHMTYSYLVPAKQKGRALAPGRRGVGRVGGGICGSKGGTAVCGDKVADVKLATWMTPASGGEWGGVLLLGDCLPYTEPLAL